jgi:protein tyrosine/serine phosphatase
VSFCRTLTRLKIRTAIDLRRANRCDKASGAIDFESLGIEYHNLHLRSSDLPHPEPLLKFSQLLVDAPRPLLLYCKRGKDKTGFGSALYRHLVRGEPLDVAWQQLRWIPFGHRPAKHQGPHRFRLLLQEQQPTDLLQWIQNDYPEIFQSGVDRGEIRPVQASG